MKIFNTRRDKIIVLIILLIVIFFIGIRPYFKNNKQNVEALEEIKPIALNWLPYNEGLLKAEKESKYVLIDFYTDWCGYCKKMDKETYTDQEVLKAISKNFVTIKINAESENKVVEGDKEITERGLANLFQVSGYPTIWFLESDNEKIAPLPGFVPAQQFKIVLDYIGEGWYKDISFEEYLEKI